MLETEQRVVRGEMKDEFPLMDEPLLVGVLVFCDTMTTPDRKVKTAEARIAEIYGRYGDDSVVGRFARQAAPEFSLSSSHIAVRAKESAHLSPPAVLVAPPCFVSRGRHLTRTAPCVNAESVDLLAHTYASPGWSCAICSERRPAKAVLAF